MTVTEADWEKLGTGQGPAGLARLRLHPDSRHDIFLAVQYPSARRMLALRLDTSIAQEVVRRLRRLPRTFGMDLQFTGLPDGRRELQLSLNDAGLSDVFNPLVTDIAADATAADTSLDAALAFVARFEHWIKLLQSLSEDGLSPEHRRGLVGELLVLRRLLDAGITQDVAVAGWTGPNSGNQDFQLANVAIEVKTSSAKHPQAMTISNERELDERGCGCLLLAHVSVDERRGGDGASLNRIVADLRSELTDVDARTRFDDLLVRTGYMQHQSQLYDEPRYSVRDEMFWRVSGEFPRITELDLRPGVGDCNYRISTAGLDGYTVPAELVEQIVRGVVDD